MTKTAERRVPDEYNRVPESPVQPVPVAGSGASGDPERDVADFFASPHATAAPFARGHASITSPEVTLEELKGRFSDPDMPAQPMSFEAYLRWLDQEVLPYSVNVSSNRFIGHMTSALPQFMSSLSAQVSSLNQNMVKIETSKALTLLERQLLAMLHKEFFRGGAGDQEQNYQERIQDPNHVFGLVVSGGSSANITALWNARNRALLELGFTKSDINEHGAFELLRQRGYAGLAIITSRLAHYSVRKAASLLGMGERHILILKQGAGQQADPADLEAALERCRRERLLVIAVVGLAGATETGTIDLLAQMGEAAARHRVHFHVDAAWGGALIFSEKHRHLLEGIETADSITFCAHKQLYLPQGISLCLFKDSQAAHASSVQAVYQGRRGSLDSGQYTLEGSRPAIFLALHALLCVVSKQGIGALVEQGIEKTRYFADVVAGHPAFELVGSPQINILNYRYIPQRLRPKAQYSLEENQLISQAVVKIQERQFLRGKTFVSRTEILNEAYCTERMAVFRVVIANPLTTRQDLLDTLADQMEIAEQLCP